MIFANRKTRIRLGIVATCVAALAGLSVYAWRVAYPAFARRLSYQAARTSTRGGGVGMRLDVQMGESSSAQRITTFPFEAGANHVELAGTLTLHNGFPQDETYALVALIDYRQVPIEIEELDQPVHVVRAGPHSEVALDFALNVPNQEGLHKLLLLLFRAPDAHPLDERFRFLTDGMCHSYTWDVAIGNSRQPPAMTTQSAPRTRPDVSQFDFSGVLVNRDGRDNRTAWITETVGQGQTLDYYIHLGNDGHPDSLYAVVAFLDWQQVPIAANGEKIFFGVIERGGRLTLPAEVQILSTGDVHELQVLYIVDPYHPETVASQGETPASVHNFIIPGLRIGLVATQ
jgi:hypothetical protein